MKNENSSQLATVFSGRRMEAEVIKGLLEANGIPSMIKDESLSTVTSPYMPIGGSVKLLVNMQDAETAKQLIKPEE